MFEQYVWVTKKHAQVAKADAINLAASTEAIRADTARIVALTEAIRSERAMHDAATEAYNAIADRCKDSVDPPSTPPPEARFQHHRRNSFFVCKCPSV
jgi:hypothetical protein